MGSIRDHWSKSRGSTSDLRHVCGELSPGVGTQPLTLNIFFLLLQHVAMSLGDPPKPVPDPKWNGVHFLNLDPFETDQLKVKSK